MITKEDWPNINELIKTYTLNEVGKKYGVSRQRIEQILKAQGIITPKRMFQYQCWLCPKTINRSQFIDKGELILCINCRNYVNSGKQNYQRAFEIGPCVRCGKGKGNRRGYCGSCYLYLYIRKNPERYKKYIQRQSAYQKRRYASDPEFRERMKKAKNAWVERNIERVREYHRNRYILKKALENS